MCLRLAFWTAHHEHHHQLHHHHEIRKRSIMRSPSHHVKSMTKFIFALIIWKLFGWIGQSDGSGKEAQFISDWVQSESDRKTSSPQILGNDMSSTGPPICDWLFLFLWPFFFSISLQGKCMHLSISYSTAAACRVKLRSWAQSGDDMKRMMMNCISEDFIISLFVLQLMMFISEWRSRFECNPNSMTLASTVCSFVYDWLSWRVIRLLT